MPTITVTEEEIKAAETFLTQIIQERHPDGDFREGSALRDLVVKALAAVTAVMRGDATRVQDYTSIARIDNLEDPQERFEAILANAANWHVTPRAGTPVRGTATLHFSEPHDGSIPVSTRFVQGTSLGFIPDNTGSYTYGTADFGVATDTSGVITSYTLRIPVIAEDVGSAYAIEPGEFSFVTPPFSRYFLFAENEQQFSAATDPETADELLERIPDAISVRDLVSKRSITTVLTENFSDITRIVVRGMGDEGMVRDLLQDPTAFFKVHLGGAIDVFIGSAILEEQVFEAVVGAEFVDPRNGYTFFTDTAVEDFRRFVVAGDVLRIYSAETDEPTEYLIKEISKHYLRVYPRQPFPEERPVQLRDGTVYTTGTLTAPDQLLDYNADFTASDVGEYVRISASTAGNDGTYKITAVDEATDTATLDATLSSEAQPGFTFSMQHGLVAYSVGDNAPAYDNHLAYAETGEFTATVREDGTVLLPAVPIYLITEVSIYDPADPDADPTTGRVYFQNRVNRTPLPKSGSELEYQVEVDDPTVAQSSRHFPRLRIGYSPEEEGAGGALSLGAVFTDTSYSFEASDVGKTVRITGSHTANNRGEFTIISHVPLPGNDGVTLQNPRDAFGWVPTPENYLEWELTEVSKYNGKAVRVVYDTIAAFDAVDNYINAGDERVTNADTLTRGFFPVYVQFDMRYRLRKNATQGINEDEARAYLEEFINTFPAEDVLHVTDLTTALYEYDSNIGGVELPLTVYYALHAPDGRVIPYATTDALELIPGRAVPAVPEEILDNPAALGVTPSTIRFLSSTALITLTQVT